MVNNLLFIQVMKMKIDYEKRNKFTGEEIDLIDQSSNSIVVKNIINRYRESKNNHFLTFITMCVMIVCSLIISHYCIVHDKHQLTVTFIIFSIYVLIELILLLFDKYLIISRILYYVYLLFFPTYGVESLHRRLAKYYPIKISYHDYSLINGYYMQGSNKIDGKDFIKVKDNTICFNPVSDYYVQYDQCNYCEIIKYINYLIVNQHSKEN